MKTHNENMHDILVKDKKIKKYIDFIWWNLVICFPTSAFCYLMIDLFFKSANPFVAITIAAFFYLFDVKNQSTSEYLQYQIDNLKDKAYYDNMFNDEKFGQLQAEINELKKK